MARSGNVISRGAHGLVGALSHFFGGRKEKEVNVPLMDPKQMEATQELLQRGMKDTDYSSVEKMLKDLFASETMPNISAHFAGRGGSASSARDEATRRAKLGLANQLANLRMNTGMSKLQLGLRPMQQTYYQPSQPGFLESAAPRALDALLGYLTGGSTGSALSSAAPKGEREKQMYSPGQPQSAVSFNQHPFQQKLWSDSWM